MSLFEEASLVLTANAFKAGKLYAVKGADLSVLRATSATRVNANGVIETVGANVPLIDHTGGGCPTILVQPQRTNLLLRSEEFDNGAWTKLNITVSANSTISPDGNLTADKIIPSGTTTSFKEIYNNIFLTAGTTHTHSFYVKSSGYQFIQILFPGANIGNMYANFDIVNGTKTYGTSGLGTIEAAGNGWFRVSATFTQVISGLGRCAVSVIPSGTSPRATSWLSNGTDGLYIWGAQLELGSNSTSYIKTTTAAVTRNADVITLTPTTGLTEIKETFENGTTNVITTIPSTYTMSQGRIKNVVMK
jgi:hypothetical protein